MAASDEMRAFSADLRAAGSGIASTVRPIVHRGANKIKRQLRAEMSTKWFKGVVRSIDHSMRYGTGSRATGGAGAIEAEIGPSSDAGSAGNLANIAYFGGAQGGGRVPDPKGALDAEAPHFEKALSDALGDLLK